MSVDDVAFGSVDGVLLVDEMVSDDGQKVLGMSHVTDHDAVSLVAELDCALVGFGHHSAACGKGATNIKYETVETTGSQRTRKHTSRTKVSLTERTSSGALV